MQLTRGAGPKPSYSQVTQQEKQELHQYVLISSAIFYFYF